MCPQCGTFEADWIDPVTRRRLDEPRWVPVVHRCYGCEEIEAEKAEIPEGEKGLHVGLGPNIDTDMHPDDDVDDWSPSDGDDLG